MKHVLLSILLWILVPSLADAQSPAQNCMGAIPVCQNTYVQNTSYTGSGSLNELNATNQGCLTTGENNSVWYILNTSTAGNLVFTITPNVSSDYDFAVWDLTDKSCAAISAGLTPIRCNYASLANSTAGGLTGLSTSTTTASIGAAGPSFSSAINVSAGQTFVILVNNASSSTSGYTLSFAGSTCQIQDNLAPFIKSDTVQTSCTGPSSVKILLNENVTCASFASNGSDFTLSPPGASITSVNSISCTAGGTYTNLFNLNFSAPLSPGTYSISVVMGSDGNTLIDNCGNAMPAGTSISFTVLPPVQVTASTQFGCPGTASGVITASNIGGTTPFQYKLNGGSYTSNNVFSGLFPGTYTLTIKDANGCTDDSIINLQQGSFIQIDSMQVHNLTCYGVNTGSVQLFASGGVSPLTYAVNTSSYSPNNTISNLAPGNYIIHIKDANGCIKDTLIFISSPGQLSINTVNIVSAGCGINNGSIQVNAFGGINPLSFAINSNPFQAASLFSNLASGTYTIHIKDANNCAKDTVVTVPQISALSITSLTITAPGCAGNTGSISIAGSGGVTPYTYSNNGSLFVSTNTFGGLASGTYTVTLKDANGCTATSSTTLTSPANLFFGTTSVSLPTCLQQGSIITSGSGGTAPYQFALNSGSYTSSSVFNALNPGTYILHIKDANGCLHDTSIVLPVIALPQLTSLNTTQASCSFPNGGAITVNASGGTAPLSYSINGGTFSTASVFNTLGAGTYTLTVKDANGCTVSSVTTITAPNTVIFNYFTHTNVGCGGTPLANIASVLLGGNAPYQYSLNGGPFQASGIFMGLNAGTYTVTGKDASGCTKTTVTTITTSVTLNINSVGATNSPCVNPPTGSISISGSGSALPITYSLNGATSVASGTFSNLPPGTYTVSVYDGNGCHKDSVVTVNGNPALSFNNPIIVHPPCSGGIGSISLQGAGGNPPYTFSLNNSPFAPGSNWPSLVAGTYTIQLQDANGCLHDTVIFLIEPPEISMSSTFVSNASCTGAATGSISVVSVNGTPPYLYALNTGPWGTNPNFTGLGPGAYAVHVLDASGCGKDTFYVINSGGNFTINSITKTKPACNGGGNGSISFAVTGGVPPYQYALNGGAFGSGFTFTSLASGTYTLHAKDSSGCFKDSIIQLGQPAALHFTNVVLNAALCFGTATASVSYSATGGTSPYQYRIDGGSWGSTSNFTSITGGTHTLSILDSAGCTKDTVIQLAQPAALHFTNVSIISPGCLGNIGVISVQGSGGVAPYSFALGSGSYTSTGMFSSLPAGTYTIHLKDNNACIYDTLITLNNTAQIALNALNYSPAICPGSTTGFIQVSANSIYPPVLYTLNTNPPQSSGNFNTLSAGTYTVHIEDQIGCFTDSILTIQAAPPIQLINLVMIQPLCFNGINGSIQMNATGGMGSLRYAINGGSYGTSSLFQNLTSGSYTLHIKDSLFCSYDTIVFLGTPPPLSFSSINLVSPYCSNATDGKITITANGGTPPYLYAINTSLYTTNNQFVNLFQGNYTVHVKDYNGCIHDTIVYLPSATYMTFTNVVVHNVSCQSGNDGSISLGVNGGFSPYQFSINAVSTGSISVFNNLGTGNYTIVVTDLLGCQADTVLPVLEPAFPVKATILNIKDNLCRGDSIGSITAGASGGTPTYTFAINGGGFQTSPLFGGLPAGNFLITVKDQNGCTDDTLAYVGEPDTSVQLLLVSIKDVSCKGVDDGEITVSSQYGIPPLYYTMNGTNTGLDTFYNQLSPGNYIVEVHDSLGCKSTGKFVVDPSDLKPAIIIDSIEGVLCAGDMNGSVDWHSIYCYPPYYYTFETVYIDTVSYRSGISNGTYHIEVRDSKGCYSDTSFSIREGDTLDVDVLATPAICSGLGNDGKADAVAIGGVPPFIYQWSQSPVNFTSHAENLWYGDHVVKLTDNLGCSDTAHFTIEYDPCCLMSLPNAFSPNGDGKNDIFRAIRFGEIRLETFEIYNRWGNLLFSTKIETDGWDGKYHGTDCDMGTYFYLVRYKCNLKKETILLKGDVTLLR